jgi:hypothetical protein
MAAIQYVAKTAGTGGQLIVSRDMTGQSGKTMPAGLWTIQSMTGYHAPRSKKGSPKLRLMQRWSGEEITHERDDWAGETLAKVKAWYPESFIFDRYLAPIFNKAGAK